MSNAIFRQMRRQLMERLDFLDTKMGVSYCAYSEEFYEEMLNAYAKSNTLEKIEGAYKAEDWNNYRINAHALKSTSRTIGAQIISDMAMHLETAAKQNDIEYIHKYHEKTMKAYKELLDKLKKIL